MAVSQRITVPKTHKGRKALEEREPKLVENDKRTLFIRGSKVSHNISEFMHDLHRLKHENSIVLKSKNAFYPMQDDTALEKLSQKYDASLFAFANHQKKRPNNLIIGRMYDYHVLDMVEFGVENVRLLSSFKTAKCALGTKPCLIFNGELFQTDETLKRCKNLLIDFFRGPTVESLHLQGIDLALSFTAVEGKILFRSYRVLLKKSGTRLPRVELVEMGPCCDFVLRRTKLASDDLFKQACKQPRQLKAKKVKNVSRDVFGSHLARIHLGKQDLSRLQTRKLKALKPTENAAQRNREAVAVGGRKRSLSASMAELPPSAAKKRQRLRASETE